MVPPCGICRSAAAKKDRGVCLRPGRRKKLAVVRAVGALALALHFGGVPAGSSFASAASPPVAATTATASASPSPVVQGTATDVHHHQQQQKSPFAAEDSEGLTFRAIPYAECIKPLAVGGQIVHCRKDGGGKPYVDFGSFEGPQGPFLGQSFPMDIPPDFFLRRALARDREKMKQKNSETESPSTSASAAEEKGSETTHMQTQEKGGTLEDPHFIRIFGRWTAYSRGLNMWLNRDARAALERRLTDENPAVALLQQHDSTIWDTPEQRPLLFARMGIVPQPRLSRPVLYWRQTLTPSPMEHSCVALIKRPITASERGPESDPSTNAAAAPPGMPESCEEVQRRVSEKKNSETSFDPFWLSCTPELQLSRPAKYITFSISQEKINKVLAALDYSVEIWEEPHEIRTPNAEGLRKPPEIIKIQPETKQEEPVAAPEHQPGEVPAFRTVEARRLSAEQDSPVEEQPKWRVGVCLLTRSKGKEGAQNKASTDVRKDGIEAKAAAISVQPPRGGEGQNAATKGEPELHREGKEEGDESGRKKEEKKTGDQPADAATFVGELKFHLSPAVASQPDVNPQEEPEAIQIRHFINAGWMYTRYIQGINVSRFNRLAIKESRGVGAQPCAGFWDEHSLLSVAPDAYSWDEATQKGTLRFVFGSALKEGVDNSDALFDALPGHHPTSRMHICFYPNEEQPFGLFMGEVRFVIDSADATLLVCFILFVFLALPLTCAVALSFHVYKHRHLRERLQRLVLVQQRDAVEQLLMRELGLSTDEQDDGNDDEDEEENHV
ncbi:uncharacterized protein EMH_0023030 [Eimeria mitis]|uniref:Transmembrane protein n=1 Tax=Eimeria mitis TaxID=44415 RepID=U6K024_9EIME|nr:uncharacterized protein EMH_0023030 [Eimeria mitis]CDJ29667.1 hypothetical protein, conserved [Eimeria mitis]